MGAVGMERLALQVHEEAEDGLAALERMAQDHEAGIAPGMLAGPHPDARRHHLPVGDGADGLAALDQQIRAAVELCGDAQRERALLPALASVIERLQSLGSDRLRLVDLEGQADVA